jgi:lysophospholipase L1-like esterase
VSIRLAVVAAAVLAVTVAVPACGGAASGAGGLPTGPSAVSSQQSGGPRILIVGDSISNGILGDYTWRYRLWQDLRGTNAVFVGHRTGTEDIYDDPADLALVNGQPAVTDDYDNPTDGYYNSSVDPEFLRDGDHHDALWGWTFGLAKNYVAQDVSTYQPDYLLVELGFDDLSFGGRSPSVLLAEAKTLIDNARAADRTVKVLIANVVTRAPLPNLPKLNATIETYDAGLAAAVPHWSTSVSPVKLVNLSSVYDPATDTYDGLHPNGEGEYVIADAFATVLAKDFGLGRVPGPPPTSVPGIAVSTPASFNVMISGSRVLLSWSQVYGATGYLIFERDVTGNPAPLPAFRQLPEPVPGDHWFTPQGLAGHTYQYEVASDRGTSQSPTTGPVTLTMPS